VNFTVTASATGLSPTSGAVGSSATITAQGFAASSALTVKVGGTTAIITSGATTGTNGSSTVTFTTPAVPNGSQTVAVTDASSNTATSGTNFTVTGITLVQQVVANGGASLSTQIFSQPDATTIGDTLILTVGDDHSNSATVSTVSGGGVTTWTKVTEQNGSSGQGEAEIWYGLVTSGSSTGITVTLSDSTNWQLANVSEWSGIAPSSPVDASTSSAGTALTFTAGPIITTQTGDLVISDAWTSFNSPGFTSPQGSTTSGYTALNETMAGGSHYRAWAAYQVDTSTGPISAGWTAPESGFYAAAIAAFKP